MNMDKHVESHRVSLVIPPVRIEEESNVVVRRLSTPFHGLPSVVDYDPDTGYITFGELIEPPAPVVHPRRYKEPAMPILDPKPGTCRHHYCWTIRRRMYGLSVDEMPIGLPWASGLLRHMPGHVKYKYPFHKSYNPLPKPKKRKKSVTPYMHDKLKHKCRAMDEMLYFYKIVMLAGSIINEAKAELCASEVEGEEEEVPDGKDKAPHGQGSNAEMGPKSEEPQGGGEEIVVETVADGGGDKSETTVKPEETESPETGGEEEAKEAVVESTEEPQPQPMEAGDNKEQSAGDNNEQSAGDNNEQS